MQRECCRGIYTGKMHLYKPLYNQLLNSFHAISLFASKNISLRVTVRVLRCHSHSGILPITEDFGFYAVRKDKRTYSFKCREEIITPMPVDSVYQQLIPTPRVCEHDISVFTVVPLTPKPWIYMPQLNSSILVPVYTVMFSKYFL